jgi:hypothetical protein
MRREDYNVPFDQSWAESAVVRPELSWCEWIGSSRLIFHAPVRGTPLALSLTARLAVTHLGFLFKLAQNSRWDSGASEVNLDGLLQYRPSARHRENTKSLPVGIHLLWLAQRDQMPARASGQFALPFSMTTQSLHLKTWA